MVELWPMAYCNDLCNDIALASFSRYNSRHGKAQCDHAWTADQNGRGHSASQSCRKDRGRRSIDMIKFAGEFGLTPVARSRLAAGIGGSPDGGKFDGLLA